jgi:hypothetical protein
MSNALLKGSYVTYKDSTFVAVGYDGNLVKILDPLTNKKLNVKVSNVTVLKHKCASSTSSFGDFLVTLKTSIIISLKTNKVMKFHASSNEAKTILASVS